MISLRVYQPPLSHSPNPLLKLVSSKNCWICHWESKRNVLVHGSIVIVGHRPVKILEFCQQMLISHWQQHLLLFFADNQIIAQTYKNLLVQAKFHGSKYHTTLCYTSEKKKYLHQSHTQFHIFLFILLEDINTKLQIQLKLAPAVKNT